MKAFKRSRSIRVPSSLLYPLPVQVPPVASTKILFHADTVPHRWNRKPGFYSWVHYCKGGGARSKRSVRLDLAQKLEHTQLKPQNRSVPFHARSSVDRLLEREDRDWSVSSVPEHLKKSPHSLLTSPNSWNLARSPLSTPVGEKKRVPSSVSHASISKSIQANHSVGSPAVTGPLCMPVRIPRSVVSGPSFLANCDVNSRIRTIQSQAKRDMRTAWFGCGSGKPVTQR